MKRILPFLMLAACSSSGPTSGEGLCVATVNIQGVHYGTLSIPSADPQAVSSEPYLTVTRDTGCLDQGETPVALGHGESNFLAVGTRIHKVEGWGPDERLVYWSEVVMEWLVLAPQPQ